MRDGAQPLTPKMAKRIQDLSKAAERARGLTFRQPVAAGIMDSETVRAKLLEELRRELSAEDMASYIASLEAFGFIPKGFDLARFMLDLLNREVAGFYEPEGKYLVFVKQDDTKLTEALGRRQAADVMVQIENEVLFHELVHALQDQHFDLKKFEVTTAFSDEGTARRALVEGDATLTTRFHSAGGHPKAIAEYEKAVKLRVQDLAAKSFALPGAAPAESSATLDNAPAWLRETLTFSYLHGFLFSRAVEKAGGRKLLDRAFTQDPPRSTEQILHPEKWHARRDDPIEIKWPDLAAELPGYRQVSEGQLGELGIQILLRQGLGETKPAAAAAAGWGGDRFVLYEKDGRRILAWITEWDTETDAQELRAALPKAGSGWQVEPAASASRRVVSIRGDLAAEERAAVVARLSAADARR